MDKVKFEDPYNFSIQRGESFVRQLRLIFEKTGEPLDVQNEWTISAALKASTDDVDPLAVFGISTAPNGVYNLELNADVTALLPVGCYYYDVKVTNNSTGFVGISAVSKFTVTKSVSYNV